jgi:hypothetical protein
VGKVLGEKVPDHSKNSDARKTPAMLIFVLENGIL